MSIQANLWSICSLSVHHCMVCEHHVPYNHRPTIPRFTMFHVLHRILNESCKSKSHAQLCHQSSTIPGMICTIPTLCIQDCQGQEQNRVMLFVVYAINGASMHWPSQYKLNLFPCVRPLVTKCQWPCCCYLQFVIVGRPEEKREMRSSREVSSRRSSNR